MYSPHSVEIKVDTGDNTVKEWYSWETESDGGTSARDIAYWFTGTTNVSELLGETVTLRKSGGELEFHLPADVKSRASHGYFHLCQLGLRTKLAIITENNKVAWSNKAKAMVTSVIGVPLLYFATIFPSLLPEQYSGTVDSVPELALYIFWVVCGMIGVLLVVYSAFNISVFILRTVARLIQDINEVER